MFVKDIRLRKYRNYNEEYLQLDEQLNVITGKNGAGKSNILESVFLACIGKSYRTNKENDLIQWSQDMYCVELNIEKKEGLFNIKILGNKNEPKSIYINGFKIGRIGELMGELNCVLFSPEDLKIIKGGPNERRRYLDIQLSQSNRNYFYHLQRYQRILKQRNKLLKQIRFDTSLESMLPVWDEKLAEEGTHIILKRHELVNQINKVSKNIHQKISSQNEIIDISYQPSLGVDVDKSAQKQLFIESLQKNAQDDIERGTTHKGCHRDDFLIRINEKEAKVFGSQGQQRTAILSLKLAEVQRMHQETQESPVLLLDDVMSELDNLRKKYLMQTVNHVQTIITTTELKDVFVNNKLNYKNIVIKNGTQIIS